MGQSYSLSNQIGKEQPTDYILPQERYNQTRATFTGNKRIFRVFRARRTLKLAGPRARVHQSVAGSAAAGVAASPGRRADPGWPARPKSKTAKRSRWCAR